MKRLTLVVAILTALAFTAPVTMSFSAPKPTGQKEQLKLEKININTADEAALLGIPGVGPSKAQKILSHRKKIGKFSSLEDLTQVKGIGEKSLEKMKPYITL